MGLDMYLLLEDKETKEKIEYSYYRKFNALQGYFAQRYDLKNGGGVFLTPTTINKIYMLLNEINYSPELGPELLPTYSGPFFGNYEYDRLYYSYIIQAASDFFHAKFIDFTKYNLYFTSDW